MSRSQIDRAVRTPGITYMVAPAERTGIASGSVDLVTVAQALHWFDRTSFFAEAGRVLKTDGVLAVWTYNLVRVTPDVDEVVDHLYGVVLEKYWPEERRMVEHAYTEISLPFTELRPPLFEMSADWDLDRFLGYLGTWSASARYRERTGIDAVAALAGELSKRWGDPADSLRVRWPLAVRASAKRGKSA